MPGRYHSREFKLDICRQIAEGHKRPAQVCREHRLADSVLSRWRKEYAERGEQAFAPRLPQEVTQAARDEQRLADLERHCGQLSLENALLKKLVSQLQWRSGTP